MNIRAKIFGGDGASGDPSLLGKKQPKGAKADALHSVRVPREASRLSNGRGADRHRLSSQTVRITHDEQDHEVQLINLSGGGAMVAGEFEPKLWDRVDLHLGENGTVECAVRWLRDDRVGLEFAHETRLECSADQQAKVLRDVIAQSFPDIEFEVVEEEPGFSHEGDENRDASRHPLIWSGVLHHDYQSTPVRLRNISETGCMIECSAPVRVGSEPLLELSEALAVSVTVEWTVGDHVGLRFHSPFDLRQLASSRPEVASSDWDPPSYLKGEGAEQRSGDPWGRTSLGRLRSDLEGFLKR